MKRQKRPFIIFSLFCCILLLKTDALLAEKIKDIQRGMSRDAFLKIYPKSSARTYRTDKKEEWLTYDYSGKENVHVVTFYFEDNQLKDWKFNDRKEVVKEYLGEYCSQGFIQHSPKIYAAIKNAFYGLPWDVFLSVTSRARPTLFTEYHYSGMGRFANSSEVYSFQDDAPSFMDGMTIIKLSTELELSDSVDAIEGIVLHEIAHRYLEHAKNKTELCRREKEANHLVKEWGFEKEFEEAKKKFGDPNDPLKEYCK